MILMPDTIIYRVNILVKDQQELLVFTDHKGRLIGDRDMNLTVVDVEGDKNETSLNEAPVKIKM